MLGRIRASGRRSTGAPPPAGRRIPLDDDFSLVVRTRGTWLHVAFTHADGSPFGGLESGLPTALRPSLWQRARDRLAGRRGSERAYLRNE